MAEDGRFETRVAGESELGQVNAVVRGESSDSGANIEVLVQTDRQEAVLQFIVDDGGVHIPPISIEAYAACVGVCAVPDIVGVLIECYKNCNGDWSKFISCVKEKSPSIGYKAIYCATKCLIG